jgi:hypothetical protein
MPRLCRVLCSLVMFLPIETAQSQSLEIGGVEISLGENINTALDKLRKAWSVFHPAALDSGSTKLWMVSASLGRNQVLLGQLTEVAGVVAQVEKQQPLVSPRDAATIYIEWDAELHRRSHNVACEMSYSSYSPSAAPKTKLLSGFRTKCGSYYLSFNTPTNLSFSTEHMDGDFSDVLYSVSMSVGRP